MQHQETSEAKENSYEVLKMENKKMILSTSELMIDKGKTVALPQGDEHSEVDRELSNIATSNGDRVDMDNESMGESQHRTKHRELTDLRPSREKGPRSDLAKELEPGRLRELQTAYTTLEDTMRQVELDSKEHNVTETWAREMYDIYSKTVSYSSDEIERSEVFKAG
jgi:hypothetical protein